MLITAFGAFNGTTWEDLCQLVFKRKYIEDGYQHIPTSPGDYGLEGFTSITGYGFQCYCPEKQYTRKELYEKQRDKITEDIGKLKLNCKDLKDILGSTKIINWVFVTPELASNALIRHARKKEQDVISWGLPFIDSNFKISLHDVDHYHLEIAEINSAKGVALNFDTVIPTLPDLNDSSEVYEKNIRRKSMSRLEPKCSLPSYANLVNALHMSTLKSFVEADGYLKRIEERAPMLYYRLIRLINEYEISVKENGITWSGSAESLTAHVRDGLISRIVRDLQPDFNETSASQVARHMIARWLAVCELDYE